MPITVFEAVTKKGVADFFQNRDDFPIIIVA
jgi:hypothetical protein